MDFEKLGGRRFFLVFATLILTAILTWFTKLSGEVYATVVISTVGALVAGHTVQKVKANSNGTTNNEPIA